ncbi:hypothetical protein STEG23_004402, partial [Scotinomys teguina]
TEATQPETTEAQDPALSGLTTSPQASKGTLCERTDSCQSVSYSRHTQLLSAVF